MLTAVTSAPTAQLRTESHAIVSAMLARRLDPSQRMRAIDHRPTSFRSTFAIEEVDVVLNEGDLLRLILKPAGLRAALPTARLSKPLFLHDPLREMSVYRHVLAPRPALGAPRVVSTMDSAETGRYWLLLERVGGTELGGVANIKVWCDVARWLARLHTELAPIAANAPPLLADRLLRYDSNLLRLWLTRALAAVRSQAPAVPPELLHRLHRLAAAYDRVLDRLLDMPVGFIHGELCPSNVLLCRELYPLRVCAVDWEMAGIGPPLLDLAGLVAGERDEARRREIALAYRAELPADERARRDEREFLEDLDFCRVQLAIQWLGWSPDAVPPRGREWAWLEETLGVAERLGEA